MGLCVILLKIEVSKMPKVVQEIKNNHAFFESLVVERKTGVDSIIKVSEERKNQKYYLINDTTLLKHVKVEDEIVFITEVRRDNYKNFKFKLRCSSFCQPPFFRYDSDGPSHRLKSGILKEEQIMTPHFNTYDKDGKPIVYQTAAQKDPVKLAALADINTGILHFCDEGNVRVGASDFPSVSILPGTLQLEVVKEDPNSGVTFE